MKFIKLFLALSASALFLSGNAFAQCSNTNLNVWSSVVNPNGRINVTTAAAMAGTACGLEAQVDFSAKHYVQDDSPTGESRYRGAFCIDPNSIAMPSSGTFRRFKLMNVRCAFGSCPYRQVMMMKLQHDGTTYSFDGYVRDGAGLPGNASSKNRFTVPISDQPTRIEWDLDIANGSLKVWVDASAESDTPVITKTVDLSQWAGGVDSLRVGGLNNPTSIAEGSAIYLDEIETRRQTFIGGSCL